MKHFRGFLPKLGFFADFRTVSLSPQRHSIGAIITCIQCKVAAILDFLVCGVLYRYAYGLEMPPIPHPSPFSIFLPWEYKGVSPPPSSTDRAGLSLLPPSPAKREPDTGKRIGFSYSTNYATF
jgi:hypothetical protein